MNEDALVLARRQKFVQRQSQIAMRGMMISSLVFGIVLSGVLPMAAGAQMVLLMLAGVLGTTRLMRGLWAARASQYLMVSQARQARQLHGRTARALPAPPVEDANLRAIQVLTNIPDEPVADRVRAVGTQLAQRLRDLKGLLAERSLSASLRQPIASEIAALESDLASLLGALVTLSAAGRRQRHDLLEQLSARLEVEQLPTGLYAGS
jgi:hypothetical protein